tara:strand:+ start:1045 stop:2046 length:1002 start_codon:yes stop_codon:yes gene_type:complete
MSFWKNKRVLVTGAAGFIGSNLVENLINEGSDLVLIDNLERGKIEYLGNSLDKAELHTEDLRSKQFCENTIKNVDIVIHLASKVGGIGFYTSNPYEVMDTNMQIDSNVLNAVIKNKIKYYFYASSAHVYPIELQGVADSPLIKEDHAYPANPELTYGWAKLIAEKQILAACVENPELNVAIARYIGIYGKNQDYKLETGSVIPVFSNRAINHPAIPFSVWGTGKETRSYCYIDDAVAGTKAMVENLVNKQIVGPYNVGQQSRVTIEDIANLVIDISEKNIEVEYDTTKETLIWGQWCDCSKIKAEIGWEAQTTLSEGLRCVYEDIKRRLDNEK